MKNILIFGFLTLVYILVVISDIAQGINLASANGVRIFEDNPTSDAYCVPYGSGQGTEMTDRTNLYGPQKAVEN